MLHKYILILPWRKHK